MSLIPPKGKMTWNAHGARPAVLRANAFD